MFKKLYGFGLFLLVATVQAAPTKTTYLVEGEYHFGNFGWEKTTIRKIPGFDTIMINGFLPKGTNAEHRQNWKGPQETELSYDKDQKYFYGTANMSHFRNGCAWQYELKVVPYADHFYVAEKFPEDSWGRPGQCTFTNFNWHYTEYPFHLLPNYLANAHRAALDNETDGKKESQWKLFVAAGAGDVEKVKALLKNNVDPNARDWRERTPIMVAKGDTFAVLLEVSDLKAVDQYGYGVLKHAPDWRSKLLALKKDSSETNVTRALILAAQEGLDLSMLNEILAYPTTPKMRETALGFLYTHLLTSASHKAYAAVGLRYVELGVSETARGKFLTQALEAKNYALAMTLLKTKPDVNQTTYDSKSPLSLAIGDGKTELAVELIELGANPNFKVGESKLPLLAWSAYNLNQNTASVMKALLDKKVDINEQDSEGRTVLDRVSDWVSTATDGFRVIKTDTQTKYYLQTYRWLSGLGAKLNKRKPVPDYLINEPKTFQ